MIARWQRMVRGAHLGNGGQPTRGLSSHRILLMLCTQEDIARAPGREISDQRILDRIANEKLTAIVERKRVGPLTQGVARTRKGRYKHVEGCQ